MLFGSSMPFNDCDSACPNREADRRRITSANANPSHRKIFAESRQTKALGLLSPRNLANPSDLLIRGNGHLQHHQATANDVAVPTTIPELSSLDVESGLDDSYKSPQLIETGKELVRDFRQGLWTFFEDFKQLTVGNEGISTAELQSAPVLAPGGISKRQNAKEKRTTLGGSPARKANASKFVREPLERPRIDVFGSEYRVGIPHDRVTEVVGLTSASIAIKPEGGNAANSSDSDGDGWDN